MALEHDDVPRFTFEQRDEILNLAARLQARHEGTIDANELMRSALEAGIDPRFVHQAAMKVARKPQALSSRAPLVALVLFTMQAAVAMRGQFHWHRQGSDPFDLPTLAFSFFVAAALGHWAGRNRALRWYVPLATMAAWSSLILAISVYEWAVGPYGPQVPQPVFGLALFQSAAALMGALVEIAPQGTRAFRLLRREKFR